MGNLALALLVTFLVLGGPFTFYFIVRILNYFWGDIKVSVVQTPFKLEDDAPYALSVSWDEKSYPYQICRVKIDYQEMFNGGRSSAFSFTFDDKSSQKRSFVIPMKLSDQDKSMLTDASLQFGYQALENSFVTFEIERRNGHVLRKKFSKKELLEKMKILKEDDKSLNLVEAREPDTWSVFSRVFPWREVVEAQDSGAKSAAKSSTASKVFDFLVTKVWIEPGCIVCDACEDEAPDVFKVLEDTCIVHDNAPLDDVGSIVAAAEGCPVEVIKYDTQKK